MGSRVGVGQQFFLGAAAAIGEGAHLPGVELGAIRGQFTGHEVGQRQVHIVAAQQDVVAHGHAVRFELAIAFQDRDQREVAGAAADVDHQDDVARLHLLAPAAAAALDPAVQGRLRLFQQGGREAGLARRFRGQFARGRVERGGNGDRHRLLVERRFRVRRVPGLAQVFEVAGRRRQRRHARHFIRRILRQDRGAAVDAGMA